MGIEFVDDLFSMAGDCFVHSPFGPHTRDLSCVLPKNQMRLGSGACDMYGQRKSGAARPWTPWCANIWYPLRSLTPLYGREQADSLMASTERLARDGAAQLDAEPHL